MQDIAPSKHVHDVVVVGARCAGAATGMLLARLGHDVVVVDRAAFPSDTVSTHAISRGGVVQLHRWGLLDAVLDTGAPAIREVSFHVDGEVLTKQVKDRAGVDLLVAPRRHVLDALLVDAAIDSGVDVRTGITVTDVCRDRDGRATGITGTDAEGRSVEVAARFVVGADGLRSGVARSMGARIIDERHRDGSVRYTYVRGLGATGTEFHLGDRLFAGVFPTHGGEANVWVCGPGSRVRPGHGAVDRDQHFLDLLRAASPRLHERVVACRRTEPVRGFHGMPNQLRQATGPGWALVGDAGYFRDAVTGHGMSDAFRDAETLACALDGALRRREDDAAALARYAATRDRDIAEIFDITCQLASYPSRERFVALQKQLSTAIEAEAQMLADRPPIPRRSATRAA